MVVVLLMDIGSIKEGVGWGRGRGMSPEPVKETEKEWSWRKDKNYESTVTELRIQEENGHCFQMINFMTLQFWHKYPIYLSLKVFSLKKYISINYPLRFCSNIGLFFYVWVVIGF